MPRRVREPTHSDGTSRLTVCPPNGVKPSDEGAGPPLLVSVPSVNARGAHVLYDEGGPCERSLFGSAVCWYAPASPPVGAGADDRIRRAFGNGADRQHRRSIGRCDVSGRGGRRWFWRPRTFSPRCGSYCRLIWVVPVCCLSARESAFNSKAFDVSRHSTAEMQNR